MFGRKTTSEEFNGFLGEGTSINGDLHFTGTLHLDGSVHGSITTSDVLIVGPRAVVEGRVKAGEVQISGSVTGDVEAARRVEILEGGRLNGDVKTPQLLIFEGGVFHGMSLGGDNVETLELAGPVHESSHSDIGEYSTH